MFLRVFEGSVRGRVKVHFFLAVVRSVVSISATDCLERAPGMTHNRAKKEKRSIALRAKCLQHLDRCKFIVRDRQIIIIIIITLTISNAP